ncbi:MAG: hypothetical protein ACREJ6_00875 [Candidatus Methylomirabilis sp.]
MPESIGDLVALLLGLALLWLLPGWLSVGERLGHRQVPQRRIKAR